MDLTLFVNRYALLMFADMLCMAAAHTSRQSRRRAMSHSETIPTRRPFSVTGRRRTRSFAMVLAAVYTLSPGAAVTMPRDMISLIRV